MYSIIDENFKVYLQSDSYGNQQDLMLGSLQEHFPAITFSIIEGIPKNDNSLSWYNIYGINLKPYKVDNTYNGEHKSYILSLCERSLNAYMIPFIGFNDLCGSFNGYYGLVSLYYRNSYIVYLTGNDDSSWRKEYSTLEEASVVFNEIIEFSKIMPLDLYEILKMYNLDFW